MIYLPCFYLCNNDVQVKNTAVPFALVDPQSGVLVWQNVASIDAIGCHGIDNKQVMPGLRGPTAGNLDYLSLLFHGDPGQLESMKASVAAGEQYKHRIPITR